MSQSNYEAWRDNLALKIKELQRLSLEYIARKGDVELPNVSNDYKKLKESISSKLRGLSDMFADKRAPEQIKRYSVSFSNLSSQQRNPDYNLRYFESIKDLSKIVELQESYLTFNDVLQKHIDDDDLNKAVEELIQILGEIIEIADDELSGKISRDLKQILKALKNRHKDSTQDLFLWLDLAAKCLIKTVENQTGIPGIDLMYEGAKIAWNARKRLIVIYEEAENEFIEARNLSFTSTAKNEITDAQLENKLLTLENKGGQSVHLMIETLQPLRHLEGMGVAEVAVGFGDEEAAILVSNPCCNRLKVHPFLDGVTHKVMA